MERIVKVGRIPGRLTQVTINSSEEYSARDLFDKADIEVNENMVINNGSSVIGLDDLVTGGVLVASAKIKGNAPKTVKVGKIPGRLVQIVVNDSECYTARDYFTIANIEIDDTMVVNVGSSKIEDIDEHLTSTPDIIVASAKIKGNGNVFKVEDWATEILTEHYGIPSEIVRQDVKLVEKEFGIVTVETMDTKEQYAIDEDLFNDVYILERKTVEAFKTYEDTVDAESYEELERIAYGEHACGCNCNCKKEEDSFKERAIDELLKLTDDLEMYEGWVKDAEAKIDVLRKLLEGVDLPF